MSNHTDTALSPGIEGAIHRDLQRIIATIDTLDRADIAAQLSYVDDAVYILGGTLTACEERIANDDFYDGEEART